MPHGVGLSKLGLQVMMIDDYPRRCHILGTFEVESMDGYRQPGSLLRGFPFYANCFTSSRSEAPMPRTRVSRINAQLILM